MPYGGTGFEKAARHGLYCPCGEQFPGVPGEPGRYAGAPFPQHNPHASGFPTALPGKAKTPRKIRGAPAGAISWRPRGAGSLCRSTISPAQSPRKRISHRTSRKSKNTPENPGCPCGGNFLASPGSRVAMPEHHFPSTIPPQANSPPHFPEKQKHPGKSGVPLRGALPWRPRGAGSLCQSTIFPAQFPRKRISRRSGRFAKQTGELF